MPARTRCVLSCLVLVMEFELAAFLPVVVAGDGAELEFDVGGGDALGDAVVGAGSGGLDDIESVAFGVGVDGSSEDESGEGAVVVGAVVLVSPAELVDGFGLEGGVGEL